MRTPDVTVESSRKMELRGGTLRVVSAPEQKLEVGIESRTIGRGEACDLRLADPKVSAIHLELVGTSEGVRIEDKGSRNGTFIGGARIASGFLIRAVEVTIGDTALAFEPALAERVSVGRASAFGPLVGASAAMRVVFERVARGAPTELSVLVTGETGTGKELVGRALHDASERRAAPFVVVDCGSIPAGLAESVLFGHERGAFTGASESRRSPFVEANGGTVFLDEIGELPLEMQPKLLRVLAERRVKPVGSNRYEPVDVRVVAATRRDLAGAVNAGTFRSDLYFRLAQLRVELPPLRARPEDIPVILAAVFNELGQPRALGRVKEDAMDRLLRHPWPGNVRELKSAALAAIALADPADPIDPSLYVGDLGIEVSTRFDAPYKEARRDVLERFETVYFGRHLLETRGNLAEVARRTGLSRMHVRRYVRLHDLAPARPAAGGKKPKPQT